MNDHQRLGFRGRSRSQRGYTNSQIKVTLWTLLILILLVETPILLMKYAESVSSREIGRAATCASNLKALSLAFAQYASDNDNCYPPYANHVVYPNTKWYATDKYGHPVRERQPHPEMLVKTLMPYTHTSTVWFCPDDPLAHNNNLTAKRVCNSVHADHNFGTYVTPQVFANYPTTVNGFEMIDSQHTHFIIGGDDPKTRPLIEEQAIQALLPVRRPFWDLFHESDRRMYLYSHDGQVQSVAQDGHVIRTPVPY